VLAEEGLGVAVLGGVWHNTCPPRPPRWPCILRRTGTGVQRRQRRICQQLIVQLGHPSIHEGRDGLHRGTQGEARLQPAAAPILRHGRLCGAHPRVRQLHERGPGSQRLLSHFCIPLSSLTATPATVGGDGASAVEPVNTSRGTLRRQRGGSGAARHSSAAAPSPPASAQCASLPACQAAACTTSPRAPPRPARGRSLPLGAGGGRLDAASTRSRGGAVGPGREAPVGGAQVTAPSRPLSTHRAAR